MTRTWRKFVFVPQDGNFVVEHVPKPIVVPKPSSPIVACKGHIHDAILFVVTCKVHHKVLLANFGQDFYYLPYFPLQIAHSWTSQIISRMDSLLKVFNFCSNESFVRSNLLQLNQILLPKYSDCLQQLVIIVEVDNCNGQCTHTVPSPYKWFNLDQLTPNTDNVWGPEPYLYLSRVPPIAKCNEISIVQELKPHSRKWKLAQTLDFTYSNVVPLYNDYLHHCYPSMCMNQIIYADYRTKSKLDLTISGTEYDANKLYNSLCLSNGVFISFKDLVQGFIALDRACRHGHTGGELRTKCIFRYYSTAGASVMTFQEVVNMYKDILACGQPNPTLNPQLSAEDLFMQLQLTHEDTISMATFIKLVGSLAIRGTANLYRCSTTASPLTEIPSKRCYDPLSVQVVTMDRLSRDGQSFPTKQINQCRQCAPQNYSLSIHPISFNIVTCTMALDHQIMQPSNNVAVVRNVLRQFSSLLNGFPKEQHVEVPEWNIQSNRLALVNNIVQMCHQAKELFVQLPRVLRCTSPVYIFGDIHGNFYDLMVYDHLFWRSAPNGHVCQSLFLGDYVDRGNHSLECILYLMSMKLLLPDKIHLLRGNHEFRLIQQQFTFFNECLGKFGDQEGYKVWQAINDAFDCMPLCAVVDEHIYCAHGGIPASCTRIESLYANIPVPLYNPMLSPTGWEILWNDPINQQQYKTFLDVCPQQEGFPLYPAGFAPNIKRGTAFYYSEDAVDRFLEQNNLGQVIRGHEVIPLGFRFAMGGKVTTIFSCSNYCGLPNQASVVFVEAGKLRVVRIETNHKFNI